MSSRPDTDRQKIDDLERTLNQVLDNQLYSIPSNDIALTNSTLGKRNSAHGSDGGNRSSLPTPHIISDLVNGVSTGIFDQLIPTAQTIILDGIGSVIDVKDIHEFVDGMIVKITPILGKTIDFLSGGNIALPSGPFSITSQEVCEMQYFADSNTWKCISTGTGGSSGLTEPLRHTVKDHGDVSLTTESITADTHNVFRLRLTGNIGISISETLPILKFQMLHLVLIQDGIGGHEVTSWDSSINGTPTIGIQPNEVTTVSLFSLDSGTTWYYVSSKGGILSGGPGATELNDLTDVTLVAPSAGNYLRYGGTVWSNSDILWPDVSKTGSSLDDFDDTLIGTPSANTVLKWSGSAWVDGNVVNANIDAGAAIDISKLAITGTPDGTKFLRDDGSWADAGSQTTFDDNSFAIFDNTDTSKIAVFQASGITTATTRTYTFPNYSGTLSTIDGTETLQNKTLETPLIKDTDGTPTDDRKIDCKDGVVGTYSGAVEIRAISKNSLQPIDNTGIEGAANIDKSKISSTGTWTIGELPSEVVLTNTVQTITSQKTFGAAGTSLVCTNQANFNGNVNLGNSSLDNIDFNGTVVSDITLLGDKVIRSSNSTEIGYLVTNDTGSAGSEGTVQIPTTTSAPGTAAVADSRFGAYHGAMGVQDTGSGSISLFVRQTDGKWAGVSLARDTLT